jgi:hypothetical protein
MGQAKSNPQIERKRCYKSVAVNPATKVQGWLAKVKCQICQLEDSAKDCPYFKDSLNLKKSSVRRGNLFPGPPDKDGKRRLSKDDADDESQDDFGDKVCLICTNLPRSISFARPASTKSHGSRLKSAGNQGDHLKSSRNGYQRCWSIRARGSNTQREPESEPTKWSIQVHAPLRTGPALRHQVTGHDQRCKFTISYVEKGWIRSWFRTAIFTQVKNRQQCLPLSGVAGVWWWG